MASHPNKRTAWTTISPVVPVHPAQLDETLAHEWRDIGRFSANMFVLRTRHRVSRLRGSAGIVQSVSLSLSVNNTAQGALWVKVHPDTRVRRRKRTPLMRPVHESLLE